MAYVLLVLLDHHRQRGICRARPVPKAPTPPQLEVTANSALNFIFRTQLEQRHAKPALTDCYLTQDRQSWNLSQIPKGRIAQVVSKGGF